MENLPSVVAMFGCSPRGLFRRCQVQSVRLRGKRDFFIRNLSNVDVVVYESSFVWTTRNLRSTLYPIDIYNTRHGHDIVSMSQKDDVTIDM